MSRVQQATDNFNRLDSTDLGANWDTHTGLNSLQIVANQVQPGAAGGTDTIESYNAVSLTNNQYAEVLASVTPGAGDTLGVCLRAAVPPTSSMYVGAGGTAGRQIYKIIAGVITVLASEAVVIVANDTVALESNGTSLALFINDVSVLSATDSALTSGRAGLEVFVDVIPLSDSIVDNFEAGNLVSAVKGRPSMGLGIGVRLG